jgi:mannose-1-phosphate guanylyltransferase
MPKPPHIHGLILAGGRGTRFWPRSRQKRAKQVLKFFGERSLIQQTVDRLKTLIPGERIWIITNGHLRPEILSQLPEVPPGQVLAEPVGRNTAPAIGLAAQILEEVDPGSLMGVFPADQLVARPARYVRLLRPAFRAAAQGNIAVLGMPPLWPETGFGYIEFPSRVKPGLLEALPVKNFREKPDLKTAKKFVSAGRFCWNAGMFFFRNSVYLHALREYLPHTATLLASLPSFSSPEFSARLKETFPLCENISVDYAVMEKAKNVVGVAADDVGWSDVGTWNALWELGARKPADNVTRGDFLPIDSSGNYVDAPGKLVALVGVHNLVVVDTEDALLIADRTQSQRVGEVVKLLEKQNRGGLL